MSLTPSSRKQNMAADASPPARFLGFTVGVSHTASLPRTLSDEEWNRLVADLRETFAARGEVRTDGARRQWRNGYLRALAAPSDAGTSRLHLRTLKGTAQSALTRGVAFVVVGIAIALFQWNAGDVAFDAATAVAALSLAAGGWSIAATAWHLPRWRAERARQMKAIAGCVAERMDEPARAQENSD